MRSIAIKLNIWMVALAAVAIATHGDDRDIPNELHAFPAEFNGENDVKGSLREKPQRLQDDGDVVDSLAVESYEQFADVAAVRRDDETEQDAEGVREQNPVRQRRLVRPETGQFLGSKWWNQWMGKKTTRGPFPVRPMRRMMPKTEGPDSRV